MSIPAPRLWAVAIAVALLAVLVTAVFHGLPPRQQARSVKATVVDVYTQGARFPRTTIVARAPDALPGQVTLDVNENTRCRVGDAIDGTETEITLMIYPRSCARSQTSSTRRP